MPKNYSAPIEKSQKLLLKVLNCLWNQYVSNRTVFTKAYLASPSFPRFKLMVKELVAIGDLLNSNPAISALQKLVTNEDGTEPYVNLFAAHADGSVAFAYNIIQALPTTDSEWEDLYQQSLQSVFNSSNNIGGNKTIVNLNTDECVSQVIQVKPELSLNPNYAPDFTTIPVVLPTWVTSASIVERSGCPGVSNTGFVDLVIEVDIKTFSFNSCENKSLKCV